MSEVFFVPFVDLDRTSRESLFERLIKKTGINFIHRGERTAVKVHFGEDGCTTYVKPFFVKKAVDYIKSLGGKPFITDANTLYSGRRRYGTQHKSLALDHGFGSIGADIVIADGEDSKNVFEERIDLKNFKSVKYGKAVHDADSLVVISHFKGHLLHGFGGAIKNVGMGLGSRSAKQMMHADVKPELYPKEKCMSCGKCAELCPEGSVVLDGGYPVFDYEKCDGCAECVTNCPNDALKLQWEWAPEKAMEKTAEACYTVLKSKKNKTVFYNFLIDITPDCDCMDHSDTPLVDDIGVLASHDPVAIDAASLHLVTQARGKINSKLRSDSNIGIDKFKLLRPKTNGAYIFEYGEKIGLGKNSFKLLNILE